MYSKIIAVDFDGTLCENKWREIGEPKCAMISKLKKEQLAGAKLILWTCRVDKLLNDAVRWCLNKGLIFDAVNENLPEIVAQFGTDTRKIFANEYIDDRNVMPEKERSDIRSWAEKEIEIACKRERGDNSNDEWDYGCACYESALKAYNSLCEDGHSGFSIGLTRQILNRLIDGKPLTPIEDNEEAWSECADISSHRGERVNYQCKRISSLFKYVYADGSVKYLDVNRFLLVDAVTDTIWHSGLVDEVLGELYPITMPYIPEDKPYKAMCEEYLTDRKNGDFDTVGILRVIEPDGKTVEINRYFKDVPDGWEEIGLEEYKNRRATHYERLKKEQEKGETQND